MCKNTARKGKGITTQLLLLIYYNAWSVSLPIDANLVGIIMYVVISSD